MKEITNENAHSTQLIHSFGVCHHYLQPHWLQRAKALRRRKGVSMSACRQRFGESKHKVEIVWGPLIICHFAGFLIEFTSLWSDVF